jgi:hypothetical protein
MTAALSIVPLVDIRDGGPPQHARQNPREARALRDACLSFFPRAALPLIPALDRASRRWLSRSRSPYVAEVEAIADTLGFSGVWLLNASYQIACTALAVEHDGAPWILRTLDWPFLGLGRYTAVARMQGAQTLGQNRDFFSVTWPGYVGALTAIAPSRFAASVNQAPMRRRTAHRYLRPYDFAVNAVDIWRKSDLMPPDQLLRYAFETCADFAAARRLLEATPVARPVIYTLVGCTPRERCVIERTETDFVSRDDETSTANDWVPCRPGWEGRIGTRRFLTSTFEDAASYSRARRDSLRNWAGHPSAARFDWVREPVLNPYTRLAVAMCPAAGVLRVVGYDREPGELLPEPVTQMREVLARLTAA